MIDTSLEIRWYLLMRPTFQGIPERRLYRGVDTSRRIVSQVHKSSSWLAVGNLLPYQASAVTVMGLCRGGGEKTSRWSVADLVNAEPQW